MGGVGFLLVWVFFIVGHIANIYQAVVGWINLEVVAEVSGLLVVKTICIFIPVAGTVLGWIGMF